MLLAHIKPNDPLGERIQDQLHNISAAYRKTETTEKESFLTEDGHPIKGETAIFRFLGAYGKMLENQREIGADACYIDPETGLSC